MTGKKKGAVTMGLDSFLNDDGDDSWAATADDDFIEQPAGGDYDRPSGGDYDRPGRDRGDRYERRRDYDDGPSDGRRSYDRPRRNYDDRPELPIPDSPPYVAHIGNLSFRATEEEVFDLFSENVAVENVQIITDRNTGRSKGFGFVTFKDRADLEEALGANNVASIQDRIISVKVSAGPKEGFRGGSQREPSRADTVDKWERGRNPPRAEKEREREPRRYDDREGRGFDRDRPRRNYEAPRERKPITIQPRTSDAPIGGPAQVKKSNPFGDAKPRDEAEIKKKQAEERALQRQRESTQKSPVTRKQGSNFRGGNKGGAGRDFSSARDNMGSAPKPKSKAPSTKQSQKKFKPPTVQKESAPIATHNIFSALQRDD